MRALGQSRWKWLPAAYIGCMALILLGYVQYDPYQIDGDAVSYMDLASSMLHGRWHETINGLWNPGYPALLALGKWMTHADRMHELGVFYWVNFCVFLVSIACTGFFARCVLRFRADGKTQAEGDSQGFPAEIFYLLAYATVFFSWQNEFSVGKIRVDGLFASLLLVAFGFLLLAVQQRRLRYDIGLGAAFGLAYLVKSPGFVLAGITFFLLAIFAGMERPGGYTVRRLAISMVAFVLVAGPYIAALSMQKGRFDFGDSGRLNYAWDTELTKAEHLLNDQPYRFGNSTVHLKHSEVELLSDPVVVSFTHFPHATYGPWFDPSYFNEGVQPHFSLRRQVELSLRESRHLLLFLIAHALIVAFVLLCLVCGMRIEPARRQRRLLTLLYLVLGISTVMYLSVHFLDRYLAGQLWIAAIATMGLLCAEGKDSRSLWLAEGAGLLFAVAMLVTGVQAVAAEHQAVKLQGIRHGWYRPVEFETATALHAHGILPGDSVACFRACNITYWARLAHVHVNAEIYDTRYMPETPTGKQIWQGLPNKPAMLRALQSTGDKALVGYFEEPPEPGEGWQQLSGAYYLLPLTAAGASSGAGGGVPARPSIDRRWK